MSITKEVNVVIHVLLLVIITTTIKDVIKIHTYDIINCGYRLITLLNLIINFVFTLSCTVYK